jgi:hypothetical protein
MVRARLGASVLPSVLVILCLAPLPLSAQHPDRPLESACETAGLLRWDNVEGQPIWVGGCPPVYDVQLKLHRFRIEPGSHVELHVPEGSVLRIRHIDQRQSNSRVQVWLSDGSGLARLAPPAAHSPSNSWLIAGDQLSAAWVRLELPKDAKCGEQIACFIARRIAPPDPFSDSCDLLSGQQAPLICVEGEPAEVVYQCVPRDAPYRLPCSGPTRVRLGARLLYDSQDTESLQSFFLRIEAPSCVIGRFDLLTTANRETCITVDGKIVVTGYEQTIEFDVPDGVNHLTVHSSADLLLQARALPTTVKPCETMPLARVESFWKLPDVIGADNVPSLIHTFDQRWSLATRTAGDNRHLDGGLLAWHLLNDAAIRNPSDSATVRAARQMRIAHTMWSTVLPESTGGRMNFSTRLMVPRKLLSPGERPKPRIPFPQFLAEDFENLGAAQFVELASNEIARYRLPSDVPVGQIRMVIDRATSAEQASVELRLDHDSPIWLQYQDPWQAPASVTEPGLLESVSSMIDMTQLPPRAKTASHEMNLPLGVRLISVQNRSREPLRLCLQRRTSRQFALSESAFWHALSTIPDRTVPLADFFAPNDDTTLSHAAVEELRNHYQPLLEWLRSQHDTVLATLDLSMPPTLPSSPLPEHIAEQRMKEAKSLVQQGHLHDALPRWTYLVEQASGMVRGEAILARAETLRLLGHTFLARNELAGRAMTDPDLALRKAAVERLLAHDVYWEDPMDAIRFVAACVVHDPATHHFAILAEQLAEQGEYSKAMLLGLACPIDQRPHQVVLAAALELRWWRVFEAELQALDPSTHTPWQTARSQLESNPQQTTSGFDDSTVNSIPLPYQNTWMHDDRLVVAAVRTERLAVDQREEGMQMYWADPENPAELWVQGPVELRLETRPLHATDRVERLSDWIWLRDAAHEWLFAVHENSRSHTLALASNEPFVPGHIEQLVIPLGPGLHRLLLRPESHPIVFRAARRSLHAVAPHADQNQAEPGRTPARTVARQANPADLGAHLAGLVLRNRHDDMWSLPISDYPAVRRLHADALLHYAEQNDAQRGNFMVFLQQLRAAYANDPYLALLESRVARWGHWQTYREVSESAGIHRLRRVTPPPHYDSAQVRYAMIAPKRSERVPDYLLSGYRQLDLQLVDSRPVTLDAHCWLPRVAFVPNSPQTIEVIVDGQVSQRFRLDDRENSHRVAIALPTGRNKLTVRISDPVRGQYVYVRIAERMRDGSLRPWTMPTEVDVEQPLFHLATPAQPVRLNLLGPMWIRVEQLTDGFSRHEDHWIASGERTLTLPAIDGVQRTLYRITEFVLRDPHPEPPPADHVARATPSKRHYLPLLAAAGTALPTPSLASYTEESSTEPDMALAVGSSGKGNGAIDATDADESLPMPPLPQTSFDEVEAERLPGPAQPLETSDLPIRSIVFLPAWDTIEQLGAAPPHATPDALQLFDAFPLNGHEDGTWGIGAGVYQRRALEEGLLSFSPAADQFLENLVSYESHDPNRNRFQRTSGLLRYREQSGPTLGATHDVWFALKDVLSDSTSDSCDPCNEVTPWWHHWRAHVQADGYTQRPGDPLNGLDDRWETALGIRGQLLRRIDVTQDIHHLPSASILGRYLSLQEPGYLPGRVDQDIFTRFKADHQVALTLSDTWIWETLPSRRWWARPALFTNEDLNPLRPDHLSLQTGVSQLSRLMHWEVAYRIAQFLDDADRRQDSTQHLLYFDATVDHWQHAGSRWELDVSVRHELGEGDTSAMLTLTWFHSRGRGYADQYPGRVEFRELRTSRAFPTWQRYERGY